MVDRERKTRTVTVKCSETERQLIVYVAELVGKTPSSFTREAATTMAVEAIATRFDRAGN